MTCKWPYDPRTASYRPSCGGFAGWARWYFLEKAMTQCPHCGMDLVYDVVDLASAQKAAREYREAQS